MCNMVNKSVKLDVVYLKVVECSILFEFAVVISHDFESASVLNRLDFELRYMNR